ncbi:hypothetical protein BRADI_4g31206v3 [Brachypodium distachyon]|uniref:Uncharacterized protein n=1 Tax=Brachypodium distachyon TaxID=15368 RepID=A0A0Q3EVP4_BRADI|nr:hypothetical protein BRADI_4g31206v3 [Brachypodium distachyon]
MPCTSAHILLSSFMVIVENPLIGLFLLFMGRNSIPRSLASAARARPLRRPSPSRRPSATARALLRPWGASVGRPRSSSDVAQPDPPRRHPPSAGLKRGLDGDDADGSLQCHRHVFPSTRGCLPLLRRDADLPLEGLKKFNLSELEAATNNFSEQSLIGESVSCTVYKA